MSEKPPLKVEVTGGTFYERNLFVGVISESVKGKGFTNVQAFAEDRVQVTGNPKGKSIFDMIQNTLPEFFNHPVTIVATTIPEPTPLGQVKLSADDGDGVSIIDTRGDVMQFLRDAADLGTPDEYTVSSTDPRAITAAVTDILDMIPTADIKVKLTIDEDPNGTYVMTRLNK